MLSTAGCNSLMSGREFVDNWLKELKECVRLGVELPRWPRGSPCTTLPTGSPLRGTGGALPFRFLLDPLLSGLLESVRPRPCHYWTILTIKFSQFTKGHLFSFNHFMDMRTTVSLSISCRKNVFVLENFNKNAFFLHEMDTLTVVLMSIKWLI